VTVVSLDMDRPFTAARARNAGFRKLRTVAPGLANVLFVDGDCEVAATWPAAALTFLEQHARVVAVCGRRRERYPERSIYNRLCDIEWDTPIGEVRSCGGDVMIRAGALEAAAGYRDDMIAGEEPELCVRLRQAGGSIWRMPDEMTLHDAGILRISQWWKRAERGGHAFAEGAYLHGKESDRHNVRETARAVVWGLAIPAGIALLSLVDLSWLWLTLVYPLQMTRLAIRYGRIGRVAWARALFALLARFAEVAGILKYFWNRLMRQPSTLIEYK